jgi:hypothetical protein
MKYKQYIKEWGNKVQLTPGMEISEEFMGLLEDLKKLFFINGEITDAQAGEKHQRNILVALNSLVNEAQSSYDNNLEKDAQ